MKPQFIPPFRFSYVEKDVFRGAYPVSLNFGFLKTLHLKTIISLIPSVVDDDLKNFCQSEGIINHCYSVPKFASQVIITATTITEIIHIMCNNENLPLYVHCLDGGHTTGLIIMCLRKLQMWSSRSMFNEFTTFINDPENCEEEFVNNYKATFEISNNRPKWLQHLSGKKTHPTLRVILIDESESESDDNDDNDDNDDDEENKDKESKDERLSDIDKTQNNK